MAMALLAHIAASSILVMARDFSLLSMHMSLTADAVDVKMASTWACRRAWDSSGGGSLEPSYDVSTLHSEYPPSPSRWRCWVHVVMRLSLRLSSRSLMSEKSLPRS